MAEPDDKAILLGPVAERKLPFNKSVATRTASELN